MVQQVDRKATPLDLVGIASALIEGFKRVFGRLPSRNEAEWLTALVFLENARGQAIIAHNWGNRIYTGGKFFWVPKWADMSLLDAQLNANELHTRHRLIAGGSVPSKFAGYESHEEGAEAFLKLFQSETHHRILKAAAANDGTAFWKAISTPHPRTKMVYCVECTGTKHRDSYQKLRDEVHKTGVYADLPKDDPPEAGAPD